MKSIAVIFLTILVVISCKSIELDPSNIVGKWRFSGITQYRSSVGTFGDWKIDKTYTNGSILEYTSDGRFLKDGKPGADCCTFGDKYSLSGNKISFTELSRSVYCASVNCYDCSTLTIEKINADSLILEVCYFKNKYVRVK
jgi:hypothetical protein